MLLFALLLAACSNEPDADLATIGNARSLAAEWALINEQSAKGQLTQTYTDTMREQLRQQLRSSASSLTRPDSRYSIEIQTLLHEPDNAAPEELRSHVAVLKHIEDGLESA
jgi:hypothetical protein